jgi:hypothetical protein
LLVAELGEHEEMLRELGFDIRRAEAQAEALRAGIAKADAMLPMLRERSSARARLAALGHGARLAHLEIAQQVVDLEHQAIALPPWIGQEVTGDPRYYNSNLVNHPYQSWSRDSDTPIKA